MTSIQQAVNALSKCSSRHFKGTLVQPVKVTAALAEVILSRTDGIKKRERISAWIENCDETDSGFAVFDPNELNALLTQKINGKQYRSFGTKQRKVQLWEVIP